MNGKWEPTLMADRELAINSDAPIEVMLLPGLVCDTRLWEAQIEGLRDIAHVTVADLSGANSIAALAESVLQQAPDGAFMLAGLSMGGYVALEVMRQNPERVLGLALLDTSAHPDSIEATDGRLALMEQSENDYAGVIGQLLPKLLHPSRLTDVATTAMVRAMAHDLGAKVFCRQQQAIMDRIDSQPHLHEINCPTLVLCGAQDKLTPPAMHAEMAEQIHGAHLVIIDECGHLSPIEQPNQVTQQLRNWITETCATYGSDKPSACVSQSAEN